MKQKNVTLNLKARDNNSKLCEFIILSDYDT